MADRHDRIAPTAHVTAYTWHRERMPHSALFVTAGGRLGFWSFRLLLEWWARLLTSSTSLQAVLEYRHRLIEHAALAHDPDVLVEIAGGLSRRGVTFAVDHGVRAIEIDLPHVIARKRAILDRSDLAGRLDLHTLVASDVLADTFPATLTGLLGESQRPVIIMEGLLSYFHLDQREQLLTSVAAALQGRQGLVLCDAYTRESRGTSLGSTVLKAAIKLVTGGEGPTDSWADWEELTASFSRAGLPSVRRVLASDLPGSARPKQGDDGSPAQVVAGTIAPQIPC